MENTEGLSKIYAAVSGVNEGSRLLGQTDRQTEDLTVLNPCV